MTLRGWSFHSVKGGVGKSTLATHCAVALARRHPSAKVWLLDLDLTGTSLADGLPLLAPRWDTEPEDLLPLSSQTLGFYDAEESRRRVEARERAAQDHACGVPFLNDWLLYAVSSWEGDELPVESVAWAWEGIPNLRVLPSSALPSDLKRAIPVVFDEEYTSFFEARLEYLLCALVEKAEETLVVVDVPPTIPGLSRAVLGLALRLTQSPRLPLSLDGEIPTPLETIPFDWRACLVATLDRQDIRSVARWLAKVGPAEERQGVRVVLNRIQAPVPEGDFKKARLHQVLAVPVQVNISEPGSPDASAFFQDTAEAYPSPLDRAIWVEDSGDLPIFGDLSEAQIARTPKAIEHLLDELD